MPEAPISSTEAAKRDALRPGSLSSLPQRTYRLRVLGMGLAFLPLAAVSWELQAHWLVWLWVVFSGLLWPHLAYLLAIRHRDPFHAELRNFVIDSAMAGSWVPLMHFNVLPSAVLLTVVSADKVHSGVRGLWLRSLPGMLLAMLGVGVLTGFAIQPETSMTVLVASLPIMVIHTLAVSMSSYRLVRRVQRQNLKLDELSRIDALTGLQNRRHWETQANALLQQHRHDGGSASLLLIDIDHFKEVNDRYGHSVGDDVLRAIAELSLRSLPAEAHVGRLGGDEFVAVVAADLASAAAAAERLRAAVEQLDFRRFPGLDCSISIGLAAAPDGELELREWIEAADRALYSAKNAGRNRMAGLEALPAQPGR